MSGCSQKTNTLTTLLQNVFLGLFHCNTFFKAKMRRLETFLQILLSLIFLAPVVQRMDNVGCLSHTLKNWTPPYDDPITTGAHHFHIMFEFKNTNFIQRILKHEKEWRKNCPTYYNEPGAGFCTITNKFQSKQVYTIYSSRKARLLSCPSFDFRRLPSIFRRCLAHFQASASLPCSQHTSRAWNWKRHQIQYGHRRAGKLGGVFLRYSCTDKVY